MSEWTPIQREQVEEIREAVIESLSERFGYEPTDEDFLDAVDDALVHELLCQGYVLIDDDMADTETHFAIVHVCGPWEVGGWNENGDPIEVQTCLRCDEEISVRVTGHPTNKKTGGWPVGKRVGIVEDKIIYDPDTVETDSVCEEECRG